ncbi:MAG TPA: 1-acyl-sn-glycerol-3-phosphate acyltransferase [Baekduia sp.]|nr:1-acyl-sn-glycerol-3-phosphate acyltransferase [Baekduia sp.]
MGDGEETRRVGDLRARSSELRSTAAAKGDELRECAAARTEVLRQTAAAKGSELRSSAAAKGSELSRGAALRGAEVRRKMRSMDVPWARCRTARMARETILQFGLRPLMGLYTRMRVSGRERFEELPPPVILVANHSSHLDTPTVLRALPLRWRQRTAVAAAADYFYKKRAVANAVALMFNTVPIMRRGGGAGSDAFDHVDRLIDQRWNLLIFPEGTRSREAKLGRLRSGAAVIAQQHGIPIVPIRLTGTHDAMPPGRNWPKRVHGFFSRRHRLEVHFGPPIVAAEGEDPAAVMSRVRSYLEGDAPEGASAPRASGPDAPQPPEGAIAAAALDEHPVKSHA